MKHHVYISKLCFLFHAGQVLQRKTNKKKWKKVYEKKLNWLCLFFFYWGSRFRWCLLRDSGLHSMTPGCTVAYCLRIFKGLLYMYKYSEYAAIKMCKRKAGWITEVDWPKFFVTKVWSKLEPTISQSQVSTTESPRPGRNHFKIFSRTATLCRA